MIRTVVFLNASMDGIPLQTVVLCWVDGEVAIAWLFVENTPTHTSA